MSRIRRARPASKPRPVPPTACPACGKMRYESKSEAKKTQRRLGRQHSRYYQCGGFWHATSWGPESGTVWYRMRK